MSTALAQGAIPDVDDAYLRQRQRDEQWRRQMDTMPDVRLGLTVTDSAVHLPNNETPCARIERMQLQGEGSDAFPWLMAAAAETTDGKTDPAIGRCLGARGIGIIVQRLQHAVLRQGLVTTRVLVEPQDLSGGVLTLTVVAGRVRQVRFADESPPRATLANAMPVQPGELLDLRALEHGLENLKRLPTVTADLQIVPAAGPDARPGDSDIVVRWSQSRPFRLNLSVDDAGSRHTGRLQSALSVAIDNPLSLNDIFYFTASGAIGDRRAGPRDSDSRSVHYSLPLGQWLLSLSHSDWTYRQSVLTERNTVTYSGGSQSSDVALTRLLHRDSVRKTTGSLRLWQRTADNHVDGEELTQQRRRTGGWEFTLAHREQVGDATLDASLAYRRGTGAFNAIPAPEEAHGGGSARMRIVRVDTQFSWPFSLGSHPLRYSAAVRSQWNGTPLTPQDRFVIGNRYTVRGFNGETLLTGDRGWLLRQEIGCAVAPLHSELYAGIDTGGVSGPSTRGLPGSRLTGAVLGVRGTAHGVAWDAFVGRPLSHPDHFPTAGTTAGFYLSFSY